MVLNGKVAIVTGAAKRIGREIALALARRGAHVAITYRRSGAAAQQTKHAIERYGIQAMAVHVDQRSASSVRQAVKRIYARFHRIDILINNASSFYATPMEKVTQDQWRDLIDSNLSGPWWFAKEVSPIMKRQRAGKIVNIADVAAFSPWPSYLPYCAAKGGLVTLTRGLAKALAPAIQVNAVAPGPILFPPGVKSSERRQAIQKTLLKRCGSPEDIVAAVLFFLEGSDFVTGTVLPVDGGRFLA